MSSPRSLLPSFEWDDDCRVRALYAPFRPRDLNPEAHDAKADFLARLVAAHADESGGVFVTLAQLENELAFEGIKPEGLEQVVR